MPFNCRRCGSLVKDTSLFCSHCGARAVQQSPGPPVWKIVLAVLLTIAVFGIAAVAALIAFCGIALSGMNTGRPDPNAQLWVIGILVGVVVMFLAWIFGIVKLMR